MSGSEPDEGELEFLAKLDLPERPECLEYLWDIYQSIAGGRQYDGMMGAKPVSWVDVEAWKSATDRYLSPDEAEAVIQLDLVVLHPAVGREPKAEQDA